MDLVKRCARNRITVGEEYIQNELMSIVKFCPRSKITRAKTDTERDYEFRKICCLK